jgi:hypothetical protein
VRNAPKHPDLLPIIKIMPRERDDAKNHDTKGAQGVIVRNSLLGADVPEHVQLLLVFSAHAFFLSGCAVETRVFRGTASALNRVSW